MKINNAKAFPIRLTSPNNGVTFSAAEQELINEKARVLTGLNGDTLRVMLEAVAREIRFLTEVGDYTLDPDRDLYDQMLNARFAYEALRLANARVDS